MTHTVGGIQTRHFRGCWVELLFSRIVVSRALRPSQFAGFRGPCGPRRGSISCLVAFPPPRISQRRTGHSGVSTLPGKKRYYGSIRKRHSGKWQVLISGRDRKRYSLGTFATKKEAELCLAEHQTNSSDTGWRSRSRGMSLFEEFATDWLADKTELRPSSRSHYNSIVKNHLLPAFGNLRLCDVSPTEVRRWYGALAQDKVGIADASYRVLRAIFNAALKERVLDESPCTLRGAGSDHSEARQIPSVEQVHRLVRAMPEKLRAGVILAAWGTLRLGEILALERADVDLSTGRVRVTKSLSEHGSRRTNVTYGPTKSKAGVRTIYLPHPVRIQLAHHLEHFVAERPDAPLFTGTTGKHLWQKAFRRPWVQAREIVGLPQLHVHDLRHFAATMAGQAGATTSELMARGGWSSVSMVARYQHASEDRDRVIAAAMNDLAADNFTDQLEESRPVAPDHQSEPRHCSKKPTVTSDNGGPPGSRSRHLGIKSPGQGVVTRC